MQPKSYCIMIISGPNYYFINVSKPQTESGPALVGELPSDFLRSDAQLNRSVGEQASQAMAEQLAQQQMVPGAAAAATAATGGAPAQYVTVGRLSITGMHRGLIFYYVKNKFISVFIHL